MNSPLSASTGASQSIGSHSVDRSEVVSEGRAELAGSLIDRVSRVDPCPTKDSPDLSRRQFADPEWQLQETIA
jgi:hypothetical protein